MTLNDYRAEWLRARAYRIFWWAAPLAVLFSGGFALFAHLAVLDAFKEGSTPASQVETLAFLPGGAAALTGLLVAILATTLVTADESSGTTRQLRIVMSDARLLVARVGVIATIALAMTVLTSIIAVVTAATLPAGMLALTIVSRLFWVNVLGTLAVHLTWGLLAFAAASLLPRAALAMGAVLTVMLGLPMAELALRGANIDTRAFTYLPEALVRAATVTGSGAVTTVPPLVATALLAAWCVGLVALGGVGLRRLRTT